MVNKKKKITVRVYTFLLEGSIEAFVISVYISTVVAQYNSRYYGRSKVILFTVMSRHGVICSFHTNAASYLNTRGLKITNIEYLLFTLQFEIKVKRFRYRCQRDSPALCILKESANEWFMINITQFLCRCIKLSLFSSSRIHNTIICELWAKTFT